VQEDRERIAILAGESDVLVTNIGDARLATAGLDAVTLRGRFAGLIHVRVSAFGLAGPPGTDSLAQATIDHWPALWCSARRPNGCVSRVTRRHWTAFTDRFGDGELPEDPRFATAAARRAHHGGRW
jgi:crotonobetainyl-CoA:carnitine CoA-transferase CaiB-like acyl-CoA transferase